MSKLPYIESFEADEQISLEEAIASSISNLTDGTIDDEICAEIGRDALYIVVAKLRPDLLGSYERFRSAGINGMKKHLGKAINAIYGSTFDGGTIGCESDCKFDPETKRVFDIEPAENSDDANFANHVSDEYVKLPDGKILRKEDGVTFDY